MKMNVQLSGMPELKLGLNDKLVTDSAKKARTRDIELYLIYKRNDVKFHQCVRLANFANNRDITFVPPDGEFDLLTYSIDQKVKPLFFTQVML